MIKFEAGQQVEVRIFNEDTQTSEWVAAIVNFRIEKGNTVAYDVDLIDSDEGALVYQDTGVTNEIR